MKHGHADRDVVIVMRDRSIPDEEMIAWLGNAHAEQFALCGELEEIVDTQELQAAAKRRGLARRVRARPAVLS